MSTPPPRGPGLAHTAKAFGPFAGFMAGTGIQIGYIAIAMGSVAGAGLYFGAFLSELGIDGAATAVQIAIFAVSTLGVVLGVISAAAMVYVFYKNIYPAPPSPYNVLPWIFAGLMAVGAAWYGFVLVARPQVAVGEDAVRAPS